MWENLNRTELEALAALYRAALRCSPYEGMDDQELLDLCNSYSRRLHEQNAQSLATAKAKEALEAAKLGPCWQGDPAKPFG